MLLLNIYEQKVCLSFLVRRVHFLVSYSIVSAAVSAGYYIVYIQLRTTIADNKRRWSIICGRIWLPAGWWRHYRRTCQSDFWQSSLTSLQLARLTTTSYLTTDTYRPSIYCITRRHCAVSGIHVIVTPLMSGSWFDIHVACWRCGRPLDLRLTGRGFKSQPTRVAKSSTCLGWG